MDFSTVERQPSVLYQGKSRQRLKFNSAAKNQSKDGLSSYAYWFSQLEIPIQLCN